MNPLLRSVVLNSLLATVLFAFSINDDHKENHYASVEIDLNSLERNDWKLSHKILGEINSYREQKKLTALNKDTLFASVYALRHCDYMKESNVVNHDFFFIRKQGLTNLGAKTVGEIIAYGYPNSSSVVSAWIRSDSHRKIVEGDYTHFGIGIAKDDLNRNYYTLLFYKK